MTPDDEALFRRLVISAADMREAHSLFRVLEGRRPEPVPAFSVEDHTRLALTVAAVVAYGRPFKRSRGAKTRALLSLADLGSFTPIERQLHSELITERDTICAHSDADLWGFHLRNDPTQGDVPHVTVPRRSFTGAYLTRAMLLSMKVQVEIGVAALRLNPAGVIESSYLPPRAS